MKKLILILAICLVPMGAWGANYYGCGAGAINADNVWCAVGDVTNGVCAKDSGDYVSGATALAGTHTLYANGCTITIPSGTFTAAKISTKGDGSKGAGGGFTANADDITVTLDASVEGGTTDCLTINNSSGTATTFNLLTTSGGGTITTDATASADGVSIVGSKVTVNIGKSGSPVTITGGGAANFAVNDTSTVTTKTIYANITGGSATSANGLTVTGATGTVNIIGDIEGGSANGAFGVNWSGIAGGTITGTSTGGGFSTANGVAHNSSGYITISNCQGDNATAASGCVGSNPVGYIKITGNIIGNTVGSAINGHIRWEPALATNYIKIDGGGTAIYASAGIGSDVGGTQVTAANTAAQIADNYFFVKKDDGIMTEGTKTGGGSGAWGF